MAKKTQESPKTKAMREKLEGVIGRKLGEKAVYKEKEDYSTENDPKYIEKLEKESYFRLKTYDQEFMKNYSGLSDDGYLIDLDGKKTYSRPSQVKSLGNIHSGITDSEFRDRIKKKFESENLKAKKEGAKTNKEMAPGKEGVKEKNVENEKESEKDEQKIDEIHKEIEKKEKDREQQEKDAKEEKVVANAMKTIGLSQEKLKDNEDWNNLTNPQKLLALEQISQNTLSRVKEIGEQRFKEKNKITLSDVKNPLALLGKMGKNITKAYQISKEGKKVLEEIQKGNPPDEKTIKEVIGVTADMKPNVIEKNGKAHIILEKIEDKMSPEEKEAVEKYNEVANKFMRMPSKWRNEKAAKASGGSFINENYKKFNDSKDKYEKAKGELLKIKAEKYKESGAEEKIGGIIAMNELNQHDSDIATLQLLNTNPELAQELKEIQNSDSFKQFLKSLNDSDTVWRGIYMTGGFVGRGAVKAVFGAIALPAMAGVMGGFRAKRKAEGKINKAFLEGMNEKTFIERKQGDGTREALINKNFGKGNISKILSGTEINAKEIAGFIDADSQIQRIEQLQKHLENAETQEDKEEIITQINARVDYIRQKQEEGLINSGKENPIAVNYKLMQKMSEVSLMCEMNKIKGYENSPDLADLDLRRQILLDKIMKENEKRFGKKEAIYKWTEIIRGAVIAGTFASTGRWLHDNLYEGSTIQENISGAISKTSDYLSAKIGGIKEYLQGLGIQTEKGIPTSVTENNVEGTTNNDLYRNPNISGEENHMIKMHNDMLDKKYANLERTESVGKIDVIEAKHGDGGIVMARKLQHDLVKKYGEDWASKPDSEVSPAVKKILGERDYKLAEDLGLYKPNQDAESSVIQLGDKLKLNEQTGEFTLENKNGIVSLNKDYSGKMFDYHSYEVKHAEDLKNEIMFNEPNQEELDARDYEPSLQEQNINELNNQKIPEYEPVINQEDVRIDSNGIKHINFHNDDNHLIFRKNNKDLNIKFFYDKDGDVSGIKIENPNPDEKYLYNSLESKSYFKKFKLDGIEDTKYKIEAADQIGEMMIQKEILSKLPSDTQEYKFFDKEIRRSETDILDRYGKILKSRKFEKLDASEIGDNLGPEKIKLVETISEDNINKIFPSEKIGTWNSIVKGKISVENLMQHNAKNELADEIKPLIYYLKRLENITEVQPYKATILHKAEPVGDYIDRALKRAAETGKLDQVKI
jgi:hypothetical protein